jgi:hypothetical protein
LAEDGQGIRDPNWGPADQQLLQGLAGEKRAILAGVSPRRTGVNLESTDPPPQRLSRLS